MDNMTKPQSFKLDTIETNTLYSLTLNPDDQHQSIGKATYKERLTRVRQQHAKLFENCGLEQTYYYFREEISIPENNTMPRYHLHGFIYFETEEAILYYLLELMKKVSLSHMYSFKKVDNFEKWWDYCNKQNLLKDFTNIFEEPKQHLLHIYDPLMYPALGEGGIPRQSKKTKVKKRRGIQLSTLKIN